jgi:hypothetical protein
MVQVLIDLFLKNTVLKILTILNDGILMWFKFKFIWNGIMDGSFEDLHDSFGIIVVLKHLELVVNSIQIFTLQSILKHNVNLLFKVENLLDEFIQVVVLVSLLFFIKNTIFIWLLDS